MCKIPHEVFSLYSPMDGFDCIREVTGMSTTTYCIPEGQLMSFIRDGDRYDVHCDALLSIRMVTDENGDVVLRREFDAWGGELAGNFDNVPGGMPYGFVGGAGCRKDLATGLVYMRARHYDPQLQRFISRDVLGSKNRYEYADNNPVKLIDVDGLEPIAPELIHIQIQTQSTSVQNGQQKKPSPPSIPAPGPIPIMIILTRPAGQPPNEEYECIRKSQCDEYYDDESGWCNSCTVGELREICEERAKYERARCKSGLFPPITRLPEDWKTNPRYALMFRPTAKFDGKQCKDSFGRPPKKNYRPKRP